MLLVERYVEAVRKQLPRRERNDIAAELRDTLLSQIEETVAEQGRRLSDDEIAAILIRYGAPDVVAARYGARNHLIGPAVYGHYKAVVRAVLWILGSLLSVGLVVTAFTADNPVTAIARLAWTGVLIVIGNLTIVTVVFARIERMKGQADTSAHWDPRDLLEATPALRTSIPRSEGVARLLSTCFWLLWWTDVLPINRWLLWSRLPLQPAPIWDALTPLIVSLMVVSISVSVVALLRPRWVRFYEASDLLLDIGIAVVLYQALGARDLIVLTDATSPAAGLAALFNWLLIVGFVALALLVVVSIGTTMWRWVAVRRRRAFAF